MISVVLKELKMSDRRKALMDSSEAKKHGFLPNRTYVWEWISCDEKMTRKFWEGLE